MDPLEFCRQQVRADAHIRHGAAGGASNARACLASLRAGRYSLTDQGYGLRANNVTLVVNWNTVPSTGLLTLNHEYKNVYRFEVPEEYSTS